MNRQEVLSRLQALGASPKRSLGQNFLIGQRVPELIVEQVQALKPEAIIEVGPGLGALTQWLVRLNIPLQLIEQDQLFSQYWQEQNLQVMEQDALKLKWSELELTQKTCLVSNLPYQISSRLLIERSLGPTEILSMVLMFQKEVAQKVMAAPHAKDYGILSVVAQAYWQIEKITEVGPKDFYPEPKVASRVLKFERKEIDWPPGFLTLIKCSFHQRRKTLLNNWQALSPQLKLTRKQELSLLQSLGYDENVRAQEISVGDFVQLHSRLLVNGN